MCFNFVEFPILVTDRLRLRQITKSDGPEIFFLRTDRIVNQFIYRPNPHKTGNDALRFIDKLAKGLGKGENINWGITLYGEDAIIGTICLWNFAENRKKAEVGYDLNPNYHQQGIMSEALKSVLNYGFSTLELDEIEAFTHHGNLGSHRLLLRHKFIVNPNRNDANNVNNVIFELKKPITFNKEPKNI